MTIDRARELVDAYVKELSEVLKSADAALLAAKAVPAPGDTRKKYIGGDGFNVITTEGRTPEEQRKYMAETLRDLAVARKRLADGAAALRKGSAKALKDAMFDALTPEERDLLGRIQKCATADLESLDKMVKYLNMTGATRVKGIADARVEYASTCDSKARDADHPRAQQQLVENLAELGKQDSKTPAS